MPGGLLALLRTTAQLSYAAAFAPKPRAQDSLGRAANTTKACSCIRHSTAGLQLPLFHGQGPGKPKHALPLQTKPAAAYGTAQLRCSWRCSTTGTAPWPTA